MNKVILLGNITRDPETRAFASGSVTKFGIAVNRRWKDAAGEAKEEVTFVDLTAWGKTGENIAKFFRKGSRIVVEGRLNMEQWDDKDTGQKRSKLVVVVNEFYFVDRKSDDAPAASKTTRPGAQVAPLPEEEIPF